MVSAVGQNSAQRMMDLARAAGAKPAVVAGQAKTDEASEAAAPAQTPAAQLAAQGAPVDTGKVAAIKAQIAAGTYQIDPKAIADKMITMDLGR